MRKLAAALGCIALLAVLVSALTTTRTAAGGVPPAPGIYVYYDWRNLDPSSYPWIKGSDVDPRWNSFETSEGVMNWSSVDNWISNAASHGKAVFLKVSANDRQEDGVPSYVYAAGVPRVWVGSLPYPKWWDPTFISKYTAMIYRLGQKYNSDPRVSAVGVSIGEYGEAMPGTGGLDWQTWPQYWTNAGLTSDIWLSYGKKVIDAYATAFPNKPLFLQEQSFPDGNTSQMWALADYAAAKGVNMGFNGLSWDNDKSSHWYSPFAKYVEPGTSMGRLEQGYASFDRRQTYWSILNALRNHSQIISIYDGPIMDWGNKEAFDFGNKYAGKTLQTTPGVWSALKEANPNVWRSNPGNYEFWLYQLDPAGTSVALFDVGADKKGMYARRTDQATGRDYLSFNIDDRYIYGGQNLVRVTVTYYDAGWDSFELQYDAATNSYKSAGIVGKSNTYTWKQAVFSLSDAAFANREGGADLRLYDRRDGDDTFHLIEVERLGPSQALPAPTNTPLPTTTPAPTNPPATTPTAILPSPTSAPSASGSITTKVTAPDDDDYQLANTGWNQFTDRVYLGNGYVAGFRFNNVTIPKGAKITSAILSVSPPWYDASQGRITIYGEASDNPANFANGSIAARPKTASSVPWDIIQPWIQGGYYQSPNIAPIVQEIVNRQGWNPGNSLVVLFDAPATIWRATVSYESSKMVTKLSITYTTGDVAASPAPTDTPVPTTTPVPTNTPLPTATPVPTNAPLTATPMPTNTSVPTTTPVPTNPPVSTSTPVPPPPAPAPPTNGSTAAKIAAPDDDHYQLANGWNQFTDRVYLGRTYIAGFRFNDLTIPKGAKITSAILSVSPPWYDASQGRITIYGEAADNPTSFANGSIAARPKTASSVPWDITQPWIQGGYYQSPNIAPIVQEIVNRQGWNPGNSLVVLFDSPATIWRATVSYESSTMVPSLSITYTSR